MVQKTSFLTQLREATAKHRKAADELKAKAENLTGYGLRWDDLEEEEKEHLERAIREQDVAMESLAGSFLASIHALFNLLGMDADNEGHQLIMLASVAEIVEGKGGASIKWSAQRYYELGNDIEEVIASLKGKASDSQIARELKRKDGEKYSWSEDHLRGLIAEAKDAANNPGLIEPTMRLALRAPQFQEFGVRDSQDLLDLPEPTNKQEAALAAKYEADFLEKYKFWHEEEGEIWTIRYAEAYRVEARKMARHVAKFEFDKNALTRAYAEIGKPPSKSKAKKGRIVR